ncbi:GNAT family N-acetyltransferase [Micromonospora parathelypteridis]|uniref:RimJ/RimL family protein N-acetyltransferase n=1 Tax=Micromonospora parathelypteridis TaxID=1839617 RepID=A0A840VZA4_9ACTN|nr:GNAT family N-acetyltransferase [Micromonospora parathelypteridis]MBB5477930.1 RimJ/RimL family protein N-acetyltransferase [Micromonospora parathelypteridis]GGO12372.1 GNAT family acetyltransferase [Micromonospora parathelypteridis]
MGVDDVGLPSTERLRLRRLTTADAGALVELDSDSEVMRFLTGGVATPLATVRDEQLPRLLAGYDRHPGLGRWAALDRETGEFLGWFALDPSADGTEAELGYRLRRATWGRGLATEGSRALVRYAFDTVGVRRVWAETMAVNERSRRVMAKAGLHHVRTFHLQWDDPIPGTEHGEVEYELRAEEWAAGQERPAARRAR